MKNTKIIWPRFKAAIIKKASISNYGHVGNKWKNKVSAKNKKKKIERNGSFRTKKKKKTELKKNSSMKGLNSKIEETEKRICDLEDRTIKIT